MGLLDRFTGFLKAERRSSPTSWDSLRNINGWVGNSPSRSAENLATVYACVQAISAALASLPAIVYRHDGKNRIEDRNHPLARLIRTGPNDRQTWPDFVEWMAAQVLLYGNALVEVRRDGAGQVVSLEAVPWTWVTVLMLPTNRLAFDVRTPALGGSIGRQRRLLQSDVIHLKDRSDDGLLGRSRLSRASEVLNGAYDAQLFAGSFFRNSATPSGVLQAPSKINKEGIDQLTAQFERAHTGASRAGRVMILDNGLTWNQTSVNPEDSELLDTRRFSVEELCRLFQVPPPIVQDYTHNTFTNSETAGRWFSQFTIGPWARKIEAEFSRALFPGDGEYQLEFDMSGFLRGDPYTRWQSYQIAIGNRVLTPNEVRQVEGWNPIEGGDVFDKPAPTPMPSPVSA
jgi:HK97 family phage portal protein